MKIALVDMDYEYRKSIGRPPRHRFPNFALMRISAWHKAQGDTVDWYPLPMEIPDKIYVAKCFTWYKDVVQFAAGDPELRRLQRWCNMAATRKKCKFEDYKG